MNAANLESVSNLEWSRQPFRALLRLAWPIAVSTMSWTVMSLIGTLFVSQVGAKELAGVGLAVTVSFALMCFAIGTLRGAKTVVSQAVGAGRHRDLDGYLAAALLLGLGFGAFALVASQLIAPLIHFATVDADVGRHAATYLRIRSLAAPMLLAYVALRETRWGEGESRSPMRASLTGNLVNITLDAILILGLGWGVHGAAIASVTGNAVELACLAWPMRARLRRLSWRPELARAVWRQGAPTGLQFVMEIGSFVLLTGIIARMSAVDGAAHQIVLQLSHLSFLPAHAIAEATSVMVGQAVGAGRDEWVKRLAARGLALAAVYAAVCTVALGLGAPAVAALFAPEAALHQVTVALIHVSLLFLITDAANVVARGVLRGAGDVRFAAVVGILTAWALTPPTAWFLGLHLGLGAVGGWIGLSAEIMLGAGVFWWRVAKGGWRPAAAASRHLVAHVVPHPERGIEARDFDEGSLSSNRVETAA
jgi:multidrug resistance protein, MATE family